MAQMGGIKGPTAGMKGGMSGKSRSGPGVKNVQSSRSNRGSNVGTRTEPIKGPDKGRG